MSKNRMLIIDLVGVTISSGLGIALAYFSITSKEWAITISILCSLIVFIFTLTLEIRAWPKPIREFRTIAVRAQEKSDAHPILKLVFQEVTKNMDVDFGRISNGTFIDERASIPELSISTVKSLTNSAFATYIDDLREALYIDPAGKRYLQAWYDKAKSLPEAGAMYRVFVLQDIASCSHETLSLIEEHLSNGVSVRVISLNVAGSIRSGCEIDFGIFDDTCLMTVAKVGEKMPVSLSVYIDHPSFSNASTLLQYRRFRERLIENSIDYPSFMKRLTEPVNRDFWNYWLMEKEPLLAPPHGPSKEDASKMINAALVALGASGQTVRVAILGLTPMLVDACNNCERVGEVVLIDQSDVVLQYKDEKVKRIQANWLTIEVSNPFDIIIGDECLNNIRGGQYSAFFRNIHALLKPGGCIYLRCMGQFGNGNKIGRRELIEAMRTTMYSAQPLSVSKVIKFLHSEELGFDLEKSEINSSRYNRIIEEMIREGIIKKSEGDPWIFPCRGSKPITLTSPDMDRIRREARPFFSLLPLIDVDGAYCTEEPDIHHFYKIIGFKLRPH